MTLLPAASVGFSVAGGAPSDARSWITVDMAGFPGDERRGYVVATEPQVRSWHGIELANQCREIILTELRRLRHLSADEALGRAMAAANGIVVARNKDVALEGRIDDLSLIGVTAIVFEGQTATFAHVPPGQLILVEDGLVYTVPEFASWFPDFIPSDELADQQAEPLGFASWTAPQMAQTEIRAGDTFILCSAAMGQAYVEEVVDSGYTEHDLRWFHHRDPDDVLDMFRDVVIARDLPNAAVAVVSFPPMPNYAQIQTLGDVRQRAVDSWRHGKAIAQQLRPSRETSTPATAVSVVDPEPLPEALAQVPTVLEGERVAPETQANQIQDRLLKVFEGSGSRNRGGWKPRSQMSEFGVPGQHGVDLFRSQSQFIGEASWRHRLPRLPLIGSNWVWPLTFVALAAVVLGGIWARDTFFTEDVDPDAVMVAIDQRIVSAREADSSADTIEELEAALGAIDSARGSGVPVDSLEQREQTVVEMLDAETNVVRMSDVQRIGSLPEEFEGSSVQGVNTPAGVFFVAGSLYQFVPDDEGSTPDLIKILSQGERINEIEVGPLWGVAFDVEGLYVTDGETVFMLPVESREWVAVRLGHINNQAWAEGPIAAFGGSVYLLQSEYRQIYRFPIVGAEPASEAAPVDWLLTGARDNVSLATDIAIDVNIFILLENGDLEIMRLGDRIKEVSPQYVGEDQAVSLVGQQRSGYLYEAVISEDGNEGRIVAFDAGGEHSVQLMLPHGFTTGDANVSEPFEGVQDVIVEESTGTIYIINKDGIWTARFFLPDLPADVVPTVEPDATPVP